MNSVNVRLKTHSIKLKTFYKNISEHNENRLRQVELQQL